MIRAILNFIGFDINPIRSVKSVNLALTWGWAGLILFLVLITPLFFYFYKFEGKKVKDSDRKLILGIRALFVVSLLILLAGLNLVVTGWIPQKNRLAVMIDTSRSMSIKDADKSRFEQVQTLFGKNNFLKNLEKQTGIAPEVFSFSNTVSPVSRQELEQLTLKPGGNQTDISGSIKDVAGNLGEGSLLGLIMISDGAFTTGENPEYALSKMRLPVSFISPGKMGSVKDLSLTLNKPPATGYLNSSLRVRGELGLYNIATKSISLKILQNNKLFKEMEIPIKAGDKKAGFAFNLPCDKEGNYRYRVEIPNLESELTYDNNNTEFLLKVVKERLKVLILAGKPSWDIKFLISALRTDPNASVDTWIKLLENRWARSKDSKLQKAQRNFDPSKSISDADIIVLNGISEKEIAPFAAEIISRVESGLSGLLLLPSSRGYADLGYSGSELEKILPVNLKNEKWRGTPGNMQLMTQDPPYNFLRIVDDPIENMGFFRTLPKFDGLFDYQEPKSGSEILLSSTVRNTAGTAIPFMVKSKYGQGNVVMFTGGPIWPMGFRMASTDRGIQNYTGFMVNLLKWLANRREDAQVAIEFPTSRGFAGQPLSVKVWVMDGKRKLQEGAQVELNVTDEKDIKTRLTCMETSEKGCYETSFIPAERGLFKIETAARFRGKLLGKAQSEILVETPTSEFDNPEIQFELMSRIASMTGGIAVSIEDADSLMKNMKSEPGKKLETKIFEARDSYLALLLLLCLPMLEWYIRRTRGLS